MTCSKGMNQSEFNVSFRHIVFFCFLSLTTVQLFGQMTVNGRIEYPDSLSIGSLYSYEGDSTLSDLLLLIVPLGGDSLSFEVRPRSDSSGLAADMSELSGNIRAVGCYGDVTDDGIMYLDQWDYETVDGSLLLTIHEKSASRVTIEVYGLTAKFTKTGNENR